MAMFSTSMAPFRLRDLGRSRLWSMHRSISWRTGVKLVLCPPVIPYIDCIMFAASSHIVLSRRNVQRIATSVCVVQVGGDIGLHVGKNFIDSFPERVVQSQIIPLMNEAKRLGEKTGSGFYMYKNRKPVKDAAAIAPILQKSREAAGLAAKVRFLSLALHIVSVI